MQFEAKVLMISDKEIGFQAYRFRQAVEAAGSEPWLSKGINFPRGSCGHLAELLGRHLIDTIRIIPDYVSQHAYQDIGGWIGGHAWLEWEGLVIDISGDQFGWPSVIVTRESAFHGLGDDTIRHQVCMEHQRDWWIRECGVLWSAIYPHLSVINSSDS